MNSNVSFKTYLSLSFFLFSMFLGAGNIIFAPPLGQAAGTHTWIAMSGFLITGVGLVLLAIVALSLSGGTVESLAGRVGGRFATVFSILLFLTLGPIYVVPRTAAVVFEVSVSPFTGADSWVLMLFSLAFIGLSVYLALNPKKMASRIGNVLTPLFLLLLLSIVAKSIITPIALFSEPLGKYIDNAFSTGFTQGYYTMDVLAAFVFGKIFIDAAKNSGVQGRELSGLFVRAGIFAVVGLGAVQLSLAGMGASSFAVLGQSYNGGQALTQIAELLLGNVGVVMLATVVFLTGLTTAVACLAAVAEYFSRLFPMLSYRAWIGMLAFISLVITNFGLSSILSLASPVLLVLYPIAITLIALVFLNRLFGGHQAVYVGAASGALVMGILDAASSVNAVPASLNEFLAAAVPGYSIGLGWISAALACGLLSLMLVPMSKGQTHANSTVT